MGYTHFGKKDDGLIMWHYWKQRHYMNTTLYRPEKQVKLKSVNWFSFGGRLDTTENVGSSSYLLTQ